VRALICWTLIVLMPSAVFAGGPQTASQPTTISDSQPTVQTPTVSQPTAATPAGVLYGNGAVYLDGAQLSNSMPVMTGDVVETKDVSAAHIEMTGSTAMVQANAIVRFRNEGVALDHGTISMATGKSLSVFTRDYQIIPVTSDWTQFEVVRSGGLIHVSALKNDVELRCGTEKPTIVKEGHQLTRPDAKNCGLGDVADSNTPAARTGPLFASPEAEGIAAAGAAGLLGWILSHGDDPVSPDSPDKP
jgi:hypothetical protein